MSSRRRGPTALRVENHPFSAYVTPNSKNPPQCTPRYPPQPCMHASSYFSLSILSSALTPPLLLPTALAGNGPGCKAILFTTHSAQERWWWSKTKRFVRGGCPQTGRQKCKGRALNKAGWSQQGRQWKRGGELERGKQNCTANERHAFRWRPNKRRSSARANRTCVCVKVRRGTGQLSAARSRRG